MADFIVCRTQVGAHHPHEQPSAWLLPAKGDHQIYCSCNSGPCYLFADLRKESFEIKIR